MPTLRKMTLRSQVPHQHGTRQALDVVSGHIQVGDWKLLYLLGKSLEPGVFGEVVVELARQIQEPKRKMKEANLKNLKISLAPVRKIY